MTDEEIKVLSALCWHACDLFSACMPYPCTLIARSTKLSLYKTRKAMRSLVAAGYAVKYSVNVNDGDKAYPPINGYTITAKATGTEQFNQAAMGGVIICEAAGFDIPHKQTYNNFNNTKVKRGGESDDGK